MTAVENLKEKILYIKVGKKDKEAFIRAYDKYVDDIFRFIYFKVGDQEEAQDITSSVFLKTWDYIQNNSIKDYKTLKSLFYKVARNLVIDHYRKKNSRASDLQIDRKDIFTELVDEKQDPVRQMEIETEMDIVRSKIFELKDDYREAVTLRYINELSISEISKIMDKSKGNTRVLIYRALNALRELVNQESISPEKGFAGTKKHERERHLEKVK